MCWELVPLAMLLPSSFVAAPRLPVLLMWLMAVAGRLFEGTSKGDAAVALSASVLVAERALSSRPVPVAAAGGGCWCCCC